MADTIKDEDRGGFLNTIFHPFQAIAENNLAYEKQQRDLDFDDWKRRQEYMSPMDEYKFNREILEDTRGDMTGVQGGQEVQSAFADKERRQKMPGGEREQAPIRPETKSPRSPEELTEMVLGQISSKGYSTPAQRRHLIKYYGGNEKKTDALNDVEMGRVRKLAVDKAMRVSGLTDSNEVPEEAVQSMYQEAKDELYPNAKDEYAETELPDTITDTKSALEFLKKKGMSEEEAISWLRNKYQQGK